MPVKRSKQVAASEATTASFWSFHLKSSPALPSESQPKMVVSPTYPAQRTQARSGFRGMSMGSGVPASPAVEPPEVEAAGASCHPLPLEFHRISAAVSSEASEAAEVAGDSEPATSSAVRDVHLYLPEEEARSPPDRSFLYLLCLRDRPTVPDPATGSQRHVLAGPLFRSELLFHSALEPSSSPQCTSAYRSSATPSSLSTAAPCRRRVSRRHDQSEP